jgi:asparaginyl-tRNA synthetase
MKKLYVSDLLKGTETGQEIELLGWIRSKRSFGSVIFLDLMDSTGIIQIVVSKDAGPSVFRKAEGIAPESSVRIKGVVTHGSREGKKEIEAKEIEIIGNVLLSVSPRPRTNFDIFDSRFANISMGKRHLYLRNEKLMAVFRFRHMLMGIIHAWFNEQDFIEINAPVLTQLLLYEDNTAFDLNFFGNKVFLTQCVAFYLESAVHAFEKVYSIGPSFRAEESRGRRHLAEFWHVKAEIAFAGLEDIVCFTESMISYIIHRSMDEGRKELKILRVTADLGRLATVPYPRITYDEALERLSRRGLKAEWGKSLGAEEEADLSQEFDTPFWVTGLPCSIEAFPYVIDPSNPRVTKTADLIAPEGFGEILGVAEKIWQPDELLERMKEKGKDIGRYDWYYELRQLGSVPHSGFGMGVERIIRWLLRLNHVRDAIPFPRLFRRAPYP